MKTLTRYPIRASGRLILKIVIACLWLLCIASAARSAGLPQPFATVSSPVDVTICSGLTARFTVTASGTGAITYAWQVSINNGTSYTDITAANGATYSGYNTATLSIPNVQVALNGGMYRCVIRDAQGGTATSAGAHLSVNQMPAVLDTTGYTIKCIGSGTDIVRHPDYDASYGYQWQLSTDHGVLWTNLTDANGYSGSGTNLLTRPASTLSMEGYLYRYIAYTASCADTSKVMDTLHVYPIPTVSANPSPLSASVCPGASASFTATASGAAPVTYQWQVKPLTTGTFTNIGDGVNYSGTTTASLTINGATTSYQYRLTASYPSSIGCAAATGPGTLTVKTLPSITIDPTDSTVCANLPAGFKVTAGGSSITYQWQTDSGTNRTKWTPVNNATAAILNLGTVTTALNGYRYRVIVNNVCDVPVTSQDKLLTVRRSGTWLGTKDTTWEEARNWCGGVPDNTIDVLVPNWPTNMPVISNNTTPAAFFKSLTIENAARLTISGGTVNNMNGPFDLQGTVAYTAVVDQPVFPADHGSLEINGSGNKILGSDVGIARNLVLAGTAKLVTGTHLLNMKNGSTPVNTSAFTDTATSWIVTGNGNAGIGNTGLGGLRIEQVDASDGAVLFPVGPTPASYNPMQLTNTGTADHFTVAVNDLVIPGGLIASGITRTWLVSEAIPGGSHVRLGLKWQTDQEQSSFNRNNAAIIRSNGSQIVEYTLAGAATGTGPFIRSDGAFTSLMQFSVASNTSVLPLNLQAFTIEKQNNGSVGLLWKTDDLPREAWFDVQRSADGSYFESIGRVNTETGKTTYGFTDNKPGAGMIYYRLKIVGMQLDPLYSGIRSLLLAAGNGARLQPSITHASSTTLFFTMQQNATVTICITDITGYVHVNRSFSLTAGEHQMPLWIGYLKSGVYYVHVTDNKGNSQVLTLMKQ